MRLARTLSALGLAALAVVGAGGPAHAQPAEPTVRVLDNFFDPAAITVVVGTTVRWTWAGANPHTVSARDGSFRSPQQTQGDYTQTFRVAGQVDYFCEVHGMSASVTVKAAPPPSPTPTPAATSARPTPSPTAARPSPPPPSPSPTRAATTPASLPSPSPTTAAPSLSTSPTPKPATVSASASASPQSSVVPPAASSSPLVLGSLDEPRPKDRTGLAIALGLLVAGLGLGLGAMLVLRGRPRTPGADETIS